jgi:hypothetical protein
LADVARGCLRSKRVERKQALVGIFQPHLRLLRHELLTQINEAITRVGNKIAMYMQEVEAIGQDQRDTQERSTSYTQDCSLTIPLLTWAQAMILLCTIPGTVDGQPKGFEPRLA